MDEDDMSLCSTSSGGSGEEMIPFNSHLSYQKLSGNSILVSLIVSKKVHIAGKAIIKVLKGSVDVCGYIISSADPPWGILSPKGHSSLLFIQGLSDELEDQEIIKTDNEVLDTMSQEDVAHIPGTVFVLSSFETEWTVGLRATLGDVLLGPKSSGIKLMLPKMEDFMLKFGFQFVAENSIEKSRLFATDPAWERVHDNLKSGSKCSTAVFGGKGVGKSTFTRWMTNKFLTKKSDTNGILYFDLDPGQTEFNPPGVIAVHLIKKPLFGPNFSHMQQPERGIYFGAVNVADFPATYIKAVIHLIEFAESNEAYSNIPWIVNTMGFCTGLGVDLAVSVIKIFRPRTLIQLSIANEKRSFPFDLNSKNVSQNNSFLASGLPQPYGTRNLENYKFIKLESVCGPTKLDNVNVRHTSAAVNQWGKSPKSLREIMIISYFAELIGAAPKYALNLVIPYRFDMTRVSLSVLNPTNGPRIPLEFATVLRTLLGNLVALCCFPSIVPPISVPEESNESSVSTKETLPVVSAQNLENHFIGYGIARAYEKSTKTLFIVSPLSLELITERVNVIIPAGNIGLPASLLISGSSNDVNVPYVEKASSGARSELDQTTRKYFNPGKKVSHSVLKNSLY